MKRQVQIKEIVETLIKQNNGINQFSKKEVEKAIMFCRGVDKRTVQTWFNVLWSFEYLEQPHKDVYTLNIPKLSELDVTPPLSAKQTFLE